MQPLTPNLLGPSTSLLNPAPPSNDPLPLNEAEDFREFGDVERRQNIYQNVLRAAKAYF